MQRIKNLKLTTKMMLAFGVVLALMLVQGIAAFVGLNSLNGATTEVTGNVLPSVKAAGDLRAQIFEYRTTAYRQHVRASDAVKAEAKAKAEKDGKLIDAAIKDYAKLIATAEEKKAYDLFVKEWASAKQSYADVQEMTDLGLPDDAVDTGFRHDGDRLWLAPDRTRVYVGGSPDDVEVWPRTVQPLGCA